MRTESYQDEFNLSGIQKKQDPLFERKAEDTVKALKQQRAGGVVHQLAGDGAKVEKNGTCFNLLTWIFQQENSEYLMMEVYPDVMKRKRPCPLMCVCKASAKSREKGHRFEFETEAGLPLFEEVSA